MKKTFYITLLLFLPFIGDSQNFADKKFYLVDSLNLNAIAENERQIVDSCLKIYHKAQDDTSRINALNEIIEESWDDNIWPKYSRKIYGIALENIKKNISKTENIFFKSALASSLNNIGFYEMNKGYLPHALKHLHSALKITEEINEKHIQGNILTNLGIIYNNQGETALCLKYAIRTLKLFEEIGDKALIARSLNNLGAAYSMNHDLENAIYYYDKAKDKCEELGDKHGVSLGLANIGTMYFKQGKIAEALVQFNKSLTILNESKGGKILRTMLLNKIGNAKFSQGDFFGDDGATKYSNDNFKLAIEIGNPELITEAAKLKSKLLEKQGDFKGALEFRNLEIRMRDSLTSEETIKAAAQQQAKYEYEKAQTISDKEHEKQMAIEKEAKEKQKIITYSTAGGLGLVGIFLFFVINRLNVTRKQKGIIELAHSELEDKNKEITDSIQYAKRIQNAILPPAKLVKEYLQESFILYKPKDIVAGDFYWLEHKEGKILFAAADCTGHGVPGAMVSVVCNNGLNRSVREHGLTDPGEILNKTREIVIAEFEKSEDEVKDGMDIALCSLEGNILKYAGANNPLWIIRNNEILETKADKQPIGKFDELLPYTTHIFELQKGDSIYIFSDGYVDQFGGDKGKKFKAAVFRELLLSIQDNLMEEQKTIIDEAFENWKGDLEQVDDVCIIGLRV